MLKENLSIYNVLLNDSIKEATKNKLKFVLSILGLIICLATITITFFISSANDKQYKMQYLQIDKNELIINNECTIDSIKLIYDSFPGVNVTYYSNEFYGKIDVTNIQYRLIKVSGNFLNEKIPSEVDEGNLETVKLLAGRTFSQEDYISNKDVIIVPQTP